MVMVDKYYCMSSFLMLRTIYDHNKTFSNCLKPFFYEENIDRKAVYTHKELNLILKHEVETICEHNKAALCLSGGIDSAILAKYMPKGSTAYTFKCIVPGLKVTDETEQAAKYARECGLVHKIIYIYWEDCLKYASTLMKNKGMPIHSIEIQIYKAALCAKNDGFDTLIFGESADVNYGGQDGLFAKDWSTDEYIKRYSYVMPDKVLKKPSIIREPFDRYSKNGFMNVHEFNRHVYYCESMGSYQNACTCAGIKFCAPFSKTFLGIPLDIKRIRNGENKYFVRNVFKDLYPDFEIPAKTPMPRPMNEWMKDYAGPKSKYFLESLDIDGFNGDQKWLIWILDRFLLDYNI